jgi:glycosyltransferase involved in cell wall biosynthesis
MLDFEAFKEKYQNVPVEEYPNRVLEAVPEPMVSVQISTYQHADFIRDCLDGVLMQETDFPVEILIGEDESSDGTREICKEYADRYPDKIRLFLHQRENNIAINGFPTGRFQVVYSHFTARGKYIAMCEGDDYWTDETKLQRQVDLLEDHPEYAGSFHKTKDANWETGEIIKIRAETTPNVVTAKDTISSDTHFHTSSFMCRSAAIQWPEWAVTGFISGDMVVFSIVAASGDLAKVDRIMSVRRRHPGGLTKTSAHKVDYHERRIRLMKALNEWHGGRFEAKLEKVISRHNNAIEHRRLPTVFERIRMRLAIRTRLKELISSFK